MRNLKAFAVFLPLLFAILALSVVADTVYAATAVNFVGNDEEFNAALKEGEQGTIGSVAIDQDFHLASSKQTKDRIRGLIARTFELGGRSVYIYGKPLDTKLASELLTLPNYTYCPSAYFLGKRETATERTWSCWSGDETMSESVIRDSIARYNLYRGN